MKKLFAMLLVLCMVFALAACGSSPAPAATAAPAAPATEAPAEPEKPAETDGDAITLDVIICQYGPNTQDWFLGSGMNGTNFVDKFEAENPGVKLNLEVVSWNDVYSVVDTRVASGQAPDILNIDVFANYANEGLLMPVKDYCPDDLFNDFFPNFIEQSVIDGVCWAVPDLASMRALWYNVDLLEEAGVEVPATWSELQDACQAIVDFYDGDVYPWGIDMTTDEGQAAFAYYVYNNGGGFIDAEGNWALNSAENVEAIEYAIGLVKDGYTNPNPETQTRYDLQDMLSSGKMAMMIGPNNMPTYVKEKEGTVNIAYAKLPVADGKEASGWGVMDRVMAFKDESAPDQAARNEAIGKFLTFFYNPENYVGWVSMEGFLPAVNSSVAALIADDPSFEGWLAMLDAFHTYPSAKAEWDQVKQGVIAAEQAALTGADVQSELDALQAKIAG